LVIVVRDMPVSCDNQLMPPRPKSRALSATKAGGEQLHPPLVTSLPFTSNWRPPRGTVVPILIEKNSILSCYDNIEKGDYYRARGPCDSKANGGRPRSV